MSETVSEKVLETMSEAIETSHTSQALPEASAASEVSSAPSLVAGLGAYLSPAMMRRASPLLHLQGRVSQFMLPSIRVVDIEFDNCRVHLCRLGKTDCPTMQSLQMCSEAEVVPLNILRSRFADVVTLWIKYLAIGSRHRYFCF